MPQMHSSIPVDGESGKRGFLVCINDTEVKSCNNREKRSCLREKFSPHFFQRLHINYWEINPKGRATSGFAIDVDVPVMLPYYAAYS